LSISYIQIGIVRSLILSDIIFYFSILFDRTYNKDSSLAK
jgi:hypothetical protein